MTKQLAKPQTQPKWPVGKPVTAKNRIPLMPIPAPEWADEKFVTRNFGVTHTPLYNLRKAGAIRSLSLKIDGAKYGKRLYHIPSIAALLADLEASEKSTGSNAK